jgi:hypothetical protein
MEWEELFVNGIYTFAGQDLPVDRMKCLDLICQRDALDACVNLKLDVRFEHFGFLCGKYDARRIYVFFKNYLSQDEKIDVFIVFKQHYYHGLIVKNDERLKDKIIKIFNKNEKILVHVRVIYYAVKEKNYDILKLIVGLTEPEKLCIGLVDNVKVDIELYEFMLNYVEPHILLEYVIQSIYERSNSAYNEYVVFLKKKIDPIHIPHLNELCHEYFGAGLDYF